MNKRRLGFFQPSYFFIIFLLFNATMRSAWELGEKERERKDLDYKKKEREEEEEQYITSTAKAKEGRQDVSPMDTKPTDTFSTNCSQIVVQVAWAPG